MPQHDLFLSYNRQDRETVKRICSQLREKGVKAFLDIDSLPKGLPWMTELSKALEETRAVAVFIGEHGPGDVQEAEVQLALARQMRLRRDNQPFPVFAVLLPGAGQARISAWLQLNTWIDMSGGIDAPGKLEELATAMCGKPPARLALPEPRRRTLVWTGLAAGLLVFAFVAWVGFSERLWPPAEIKGPLTVRWYDPSMWEGASWQTGKKPAPTLLVSGATPGFLKIPSGERLRDFEVTFNLAVRSEQHSAAWIVRAASGNTYYLFRYSFPREGGAGSFQGLLRRAGKPPQEFCAQALYREPFSAGHALIVFCRVTGISAEHRFSLTCPLSDERCQGDHDLLENELQRIPCILPPGGPALGRFGFLAGNDSEGMEIQEFEIQGLGQGAK